MWIVVEEFIKKRVKIILLEKVQMQSKKKE